MKKNHIFEELRRRLYGCGQTQDEIAAGSGVSQSTVGRLMRGDSKPNLATYELLDAYLPPLKKDEKTSRRGRPRTPLNLDDEVAGAGA